jgi:hypothetical protein
MALGFAPYELFGGGINGSSQFRTTYVDFAGSGMVHLCGGTISLIAAAIIGPRIGRFPEREVRMLKGAAKAPKSVEIKGHSVPVFFGQFIFIPSKISLPLSVASSSCSAFWPSMAAPPAKFQRPALAKPLPKRWSTQFYAVHSPHSPIFLCTFFVKENGPFY